MTWLQRFTQGVWSALMSREWERKTYHLAFPVKSIMPGLVVLTSPMLAGGDVCQYVIAVRRTIHTLLEVFVELYEVKSVRSQHEIGDPYDELIVGSGLDRTIFREGLNNCDGFIEFSLLRHGKMKRLEPRRESHTACDSRDWLRRPDHPHS